MGIALRSACVTVNRHKNSDMKILECSTENRLPLITWCFHADLVTELRFAIKIELLSSEERTLEFIHSFNYKGS